MIRKKIKMLKSQDKNLEFINPKNIDDKFISLFNKPGPYYSSYPILGNWKDIAQTSINYEKSLQDFFTKNPNKPTTLYVHIPYCAKLCYYCSCRMHISNNRNVINSFVQLLIKEIVMLSDLFKRNKITPNIKEIHLGGGTPSHLSIQEIQEILKNLENFVSFKNLNEFSMEIDPRTVKNEDFVEYAKLGVDRISFGVQDFDPGVQKKINRVQPYELVKKLMDSELRKHFKGVNFDLLYGLPCQTLETFSNTIELTKKLSPDRITLIKYAHIPNKRKHLNLIKDEDLPKPELLPIMFSDSAKKLIEADYSWVGIDHFAKKGDELAIAKKKGKVYRNFGGETPGYTKDMISLGPTSTSGFGEYYFQSTYDLNEYRDTVKLGKFPISKSYLLSQDDIIRRECNFHLQCNQRLDIKEINLKFDIDFSNYFKNEIIKLQELEKQKMLIITKDQIKVTTLGRYFVRHICQVFDTFFDQSKKYEVHGN